jgi:molybdenum cofactor biosynthesis enzyme MoaA
LHVEASTFCNAWCPACPRNQKGIGLNPNLVEQNLSVKNFKKVIDQLGKLDGIQFCGNYGDPIACNHLDELLNIAKHATRKIQIHTNGSLRNTEWWQNLATELAEIEHDVWFGIDGIGSVHEIYRQATSYEKVIENAQAFIGAGGTATWQFIPYKHNEHQIMDCMRLSQQYKFSKFKVVKSHRNIEEAKHWKTGEPFQLVVSDIYQTLFFKPKQGILKKENCMHLEQPGIYLSANGKISPCCYFSEHRSFDNVNKMLYNLNIGNSLDNPDKLCLINCGT